MSFNRTILSLLSLLLITSFLQAQESETKKAPMLVGKIDIIELQNKPYGNWYFEEFNSYLPDTNMTKYMYLDDVQIAVYLGTWCSDSRREVPRFVKVLWQAGYDLQKLDITCLDRNKRAPDYQENIFDIQYVPTFIIFQHGKEIGRIIETPENTLESDLLKILSE